MRTPRDGLVAVEDAEHWYDGRSMQLPVRGFRRAHGLGNDYLVVDGRSFGLPMTAPRARRLCDRHRGVGSDGVLVQEEPPAGFDAAVRIFNPDGSEAEKSGNGVRIFAATCFSLGADPTRSLRIHTLGGEVVARLVAQEADRSVLTLSMGKVSFAMRDLPMLSPSGGPMLSPSGGPMLSPSGGPMLSPSGGPMLSPSGGPSDEEWVARPLRVGDEEPVVTCLSVGNPHVVLLDAPCDEATLARLGPEIERHPQFPRRTNVQLCSVVDRRRVRALIWERGAGPTLASGSSACAVVAACVRAGRLDLGQDIDVDMPGGSLRVRVHEGYALEQTGPVERICDGVVADELWCALSDER